MGSEHGNYHNHRHQFQPPPPIKFHEHPISRRQLTSQEASFPIVLVAIIGILTTAFLLVSYYVFVIKCCLNWHRIDVLRPRRRDEDQSIVYAPPTGNPGSGLDESVIRAIPIVQFKRVKEEGQERSLCECAVCLNEFQEEEKLRVLPSCSHVFHIDCIDIWLQSNANCPLCRASVSTTFSLFSSNPIAANPSSPRRDHDRFSTNRTVMGGDANFVIIEVRNGDDQEVPSAQPMNPSPRKLDQRILNGQKKAKKLNWVSSMGDECIDVRRKDDHFAVQPIRRSISMDSSTDRQLYLSVQEVLQQQRRHFNDFSSASTEGCTSSGGSSSSRMRRSFFSFGSGRGSKSAVLSVESEPKN